MRRIRASPASKPAGSSSSHAKTGLQPDSARFLDIADVGKEGQGVVENGLETAQLVTTARTDLPEDGYYLSPAVFAGVAPDDPLAQEEIFGPVTAVLCADDFEHALVLANDTRYALTGGVYSRRPAHLERARAHFQAGNLYLNRKITGALVSRQPFGGFKLSGVGSKAGGTDYLKQFMDPVCITENTMRRGFAPGPDDEVP